MFVAPSPLMETAGDVMVPLPLLLVPVMRPLKVPSALPLMLSLPAAGKSPARALMSIFLAEMFRVMSGVLPGLTVPVPERVPPLNPAENLSILKAFAVPESWRVASAAVIPEREILGDEAFTVKEGFEAGPFRDAVPRPFPGGGNAVRWPLTWQRGQLWRR